MSNFEKILHVLAIYMLCIFGNLLLVTVGGIQTGIVFMHICMVGTIMLIGIKAWRWLHVR